MLKAIAKLRIFFIIIECFGNYFNNWNKFFTFAI